MWHYLRYRNVFHVTYRLAMNAESPPEVAELYRRHARDVTRWAGRLGKGQVDPEDVLHDVFLVVQRRWSEFRGGARVTTWLYAITERVCQAHRKAARRGFVREQLALSAPPPITAPRDPEEDFERRRDGRRLCELLGALDDKHRTALILFAVDGLSSAQIAARTGTSRENVWVRVSRARAHLSRALAA